MARKIVSRPGSDDTSRALYIEEENALRPFYFLVTFWGDRFRDWFCQYTLPSLLAPNNIPALKHRKYCQFLICTTRDDWKALNRQPIFRKLRKIINVVFLENEEAFVGEHKYPRMSRGHKKLADACFQYSAIAININPDSLYPDGCIAELQRLASEGKAVVLCAAIRFEMDGISDELDARDIMRHNQPLVLPMRDAVDIGLRNLHSESKAADWTATNFGRLSPEHQRRHLLTCCIWRTPGAQECVIVTHNWAPCLVDYASLKEHDTSTLDGRAIDGDYIFENFGDGTEQHSIHVVTDSDSIFLLGLTPRDEMIPPKEWRWWKQIPPFGEWTRGYILNQTVFDPAMDPLKRRLYSLGVRWHADKFSEQWSKTERYANHCITKFMISNDLSKFADYREGRVFDLITEQGLKAAARHLWHATIHDMLFSPVDSVTRTARIRNKIRERALASKAYVWGRAVARAIFLADKSAKARINARVGRLTAPIKRRLRQGAAIVTMTVILFALANYGAARWISNPESASPESFVAKLAGPRSDIGETVLPEAFGQNYATALEIYESSPAFTVHPDPVGPTTLVVNEHFEIGVEGVRYEPGWTDETVTNFLDGRANIVLLLGGSTMLGHGVGARDTIAHNLNEYLGQEENITFLNLGSQAYDQQQGLEKLAYLLRAGVRPSAVVFLDGWSDIFSIAHRSMWKRNKRVTHGLAARAPIDERNHWRMLLQSLPLYRAARAIMNPPPAAGDSFGGRDTFLDGLNFSDPEIARAYWADYAMANKAALKSEIVSYYRANLAYLEGLAGGFDFQFLVAYQPIGLLDPANPFVGDDARIAKGYAYVRQMDDVVRRAISVGDLDMVDISDVLSDTPYPAYIDAAHYSPAANSALAKLIGSLLPVEQSQTVDTTGSSP